MLNTILENIIIFIVFIFLFLFVFIDIIHEYCKKHVDKLEDKEIEVKK